MIPVPITLTAEQALYAASCGCKWWLRARLERRTTTRNLGPNNESGLPADIGGAFAEYAVAIWAGEPWDGGDAAFLAAPRGDPPPDVCGWEVRATWRGGGHLILDQRDLTKGRRVFILCTLEAFPTVHIRGYRWGAKVMVPQYQRGPKWWMPQADLLPCPAKPRRRVVDVAAPVAQNETAPRWETGGGSGSFAASARGICGPSFAAGALARQPGGR